MNILLLGKDGQVGRALQRVLPAIGSVVALGRHEVDLENLDALRSALKAHPAEVIVNAAAYTAVDRAQAESARAYRVNAEAVQVLADHASLHNALLVHYSTDYVFDGNKPEPYDLEDTPHPLGVYGKSKWAGEQAIGEASCQALVFRTSWVFSPDGGNFIKTILRLAAERDTLRVVADQVGAPTSARLIAEVTARAIVAARAFKLPLGVYHLTCAGHTTWHGLACFVVAGARARGADLALVLDKIEAITTDQYPVPAPRPKNSRLESSALATALGYDFPVWQEEVDHTLDVLLAGQVAA